MKRSGPRTAVVALAVLAVALGGTLFPAAGFGSVPADETDLIGTDVPTDRADDPAPVTVREAGTETDPPETPGATSTPAGTGMDSPTPDSTPEPPDPTPTPTPASEDTDGSDGDGLGLFAPLLGGGLVILVAATLLGGLSSLAGRGGSGSGPTLGPLSVGWPFGGGGVSPAGLVKRVPQATMVALVGASTGTARVLSTVGSVAGDAAAGLATVVGGGSRATGSVLAELGSLFSASGGSVLSLPGVLSGLAVGGSGGASGRAPDADARAAASVEPETSEDPIRTVEDAWAAFAEPLAVADREARTPGELARAAVDRGDPAEAVERLRDVFRDVRYGGAPVTDDRTRAAVEAARTVLARREDDE